MYGPNEVKSEKDPSVPVAAPMVPAPEFIGVVLFKITVDVATSVMVTFPKSSSASALLTTGVGYKVGADVGGKPPESYADKPVDVPAQINAPEFVANAVIPNKL